MMSEAVDVSRQCTFSSPVDITAILDRLEVQFLEVHDRRAIVIFAGAILNLESLNGDLTALKQANITVYDLPLGGESGTEAAIELIEDFRNQLVSTNNSS